MPLETSLDEFLDAGAEAAAARERPGDTAAPRTPPGLEVPADSSGRSGYVSEGPLEPPPPRMKTPEPWWTCLSCGSDSFSWDADGWRCAVCTSRDYFNKSAPTRRETSGGTWLFIPSGEREPNEDEGPSSTLRRPSTLANASPTSPWRPSAGFGAQAPVWHEFAEGGREQAESEAATTDVIVDPDTFLSQTVRLGLRKRSWLSHQDPLHQRWTDNMIKVMQGPCEHPAHMLAKSGNRHGSFQKCCQCNTRWKWVCHAWEELPSSPLPRPSPPSARYGARNIWASRLLPGLEVQGDTATSSGSRLVTGLKPKPKPSPRHRGELDFTEEEVAAMHLEVAAAYGADQRGDGDDGGSASTADSRTRASSNSGRRAGTWSGVRWGVRVGPGRGALKTGQQAWLVSELRKAQNDYSREIDVHREMPTYKDVHSLPKIDIFEMFAGKTYGLSARLPLRPRPLPPGAG
eukprot:s1266_g3.t1